MIFLIILLIVLLGVNIVLIYTVKVLFITVKDTEDWRIRFKTYYEVTNKWIKNKNFRISLGKTLLLKNIKSIAIYGTGELAQRLYEEIKDSDINIVCFIESSVQKENAQLDGTKIINLKDIKEQGDIDLIIITPIYAFSAIEKSLKLLGVDNNKIKGLGEIVEEAL
jgi:hypothetical protein